jgi:DNA-binding NtrC family response regulator
MTIATQMLKAATPGRYLEQPLLLCLTDDDTTVTILKQMFGARMEIISTADQIEALYLIRFGSPVAVIFDMAPQHFMAGVESLHFQCSAQNLPLVAVAPSRQAAAFVQAISVGAVQCVLKPLSLNNLNAMHLHRLVESFERDAPDALQVQRLAGA